MNIPQFSLSRQDNDLLQQVFIVKHPSDMAPLLPDKRIPADAKMERVAGIYLISEASPRDGWIACQACGTRNNHRKGFVAQFDIGRATIGRTCAKKKHELEYGEYLATFQDDRLRSIALKRFIAALEALPTFLAEIRRCEDHPLVADLAARRLELESGFPEVLQTLARFPDGIVTVNVREIDVEKARRRDSAKHRKIEAWADRKGIKPEAITPAMVQAEFANDADFSDEPPTRVVPKAIGRFAGAWFICGLPLLPARLSSLRRRGVVFGQKWDGKSSSSLATNAILAETRYFTSLIQELEGYLATIQASQDFHAVSNLTTIVATLNRMKAFRREGRGLSMRDGRLCQGGRTLSPLRPQTMDSTVIGNLLRAVTTGEEKEEEALTVLAGHSA